MRPVRLLDPPAQQTPPLPLVAGLSQMSKEVEEELLFPSSEVHFSPERSIIGVRPQDVDRDSADDGKILWPVIFTGSGIIFVEDYVEWPMELIFDAPVRAGDLEHALGRQRFGQDHVMHRLDEL